MKSMTGFGRGAVSDETFSVSVELKTVNNRFLDVNLRLSGEMQAVDTAGVEPMSHPRDVAQRLRPDEVTETDRRARLLPLAPRSEAGLYLVPKVIE